MGRLLFAEGTPRLAIFQVQSGLVTLFHHRRTQPEVHLGFVEPGGFAGLGCLPHNVCSARTIADTRLVRYSLSDFDQLAARFPAIEAANRRAIEHELRLVREQAVAATANSVERRVAALLTVLARTNGYEGRDRALIADDLNCRAVADQLDIEIDDLAFALSELEAKGWISPDRRSKSIRIVDLQALDRFSDGA